MNELQERYLENYKEKLVAEPIKGNVNNNIDIDNDMLFIHLYVYVYAMHHNYTYTNIQRRHCSWNGIRMQCID